MVARSPATEESKGDSEAFSVVDLQGAADSNCRRAAPGRRADSRDAALAVPALPRRHGAPKSISMGSHREPLDDSALGGLFLIRRCNYQFLGSGRLQILRLRPTRRMFSRSARTSADSVGAHAARVALHAQSLADIDHHCRCLGALAVWDLANLAWMARVRVRYVVAREGGCRRFPGTRSPHARILYRLLSRRLVAT